MVRGSNSITINTTVELKQLIDWCKQREQQTLLHDSFYIARDFLVRHEEDFVNLHMKLQNMTEEEARKLYQTELDRWSRTQNELRDIAEKRKEEKEENVLTDAKKIERKREIKGEIEECIETIRAIKNPKDPKQKEAIDRKEQLERELASFE